MPRRLRGSTGQRQVCCWYFCREGWFQHAQRQLFTERGERIKGGIMMVRVSRKTFLISLTSRPLTNV
jgi:hypothetical protein